jgi:hypothetical protein
MSSVPKKKIYAEKRIMAREAYLNGNRDIYSLAELVGCSPVTMKKWIEKYGWAEEEMELMGLEKTAELERRRAYVAALRSFAKDPTNYNLQSLVQLLKAEERRTAPSKDLNDHIVVFLDQTTDYMLENDLDMLLKEFKKIVMPLSEYLRKRNQ